MLYHSHLAITCSHTGTQGPTTGERWETQRTNRPLLKRFWLALFFSQCPDVSDVSGSSGEAPQDETLRWFLQRRCPRPKVHERAEKLPASPFYSFMTHLWLIYDQVLFVGPVDWTVNCRKYRQVLKHTWNAHTSEMIRLYQELPGSAKNL